MVTRMDSPRSFIFKLTLVLENFLYAGQFHKSIPCIRGRSSDILFPNHQTKCGSLHFNLCTHSIRVHLSQSSCHIFQFVLCLAVLLRNRLLHDELLACFVMRQDVNSVPHVTSVQNYYGFPLSFCQFLPDFLNL